MSLRIAIRPTTKETVSNVPQDFIWTQTENVKLYLTTALKLIPLESVLNVFQDTI